MFFRKKTSEKQIMKETYGKVTDLRRKGIDFPTVVTVQYSVGEKTFTIKESLKLKSELIKIGSLPIGQRKTPKVNCNAGDTVTIIYPENKPGKGHIKNNDGFVNV